jgi:hypothetical protein
MTHEPMWSKESSGLGALWEHRETDVVVSVRCRQTNRNHRDEKEYRVKVRPERGAEPVWPAARNDTSARFSSWSQAIKAAEHIRHHITMGRSIEKLPAGGAD